MNEQHCQEHFKVSQDRTGIQPTNSANAIPRGIKKKYRNIEWELYFVLLLSLLYTSRILLQISFCSNEAQRLRFLLKQTVGKGPPVAGMKCTKQSINFVPSQI